MILLSLRGLEKFKNLTERKRFYMSDYGFQNSREVLKGETDVLVKNPINHDKFYMENIVSGGRTRHRLGIKLLHQMTDFDGN